MILSDTDIQHYLEYPATNGIRIDPLDRDQIQPASVDLTLGSNFLIHADDDRSAVVLGNKDTLPVMVDPGEYNLLNEVGAYPLEPGGFCLGTTAERVQLGLQFAAQIEGRSSIGRLGLSVHVTAGFIDPGFDGTITLEICNFSPRTIVLVPGVRICQLAIMRCSAPATIPYGDKRRLSKYQGQNGTRPSLGV